MKETNSNQKIIQEVVIGNTTEGWHPNYDGLPRVVIDNLDVPMNRSQRKKRQDLVVRTLLDMAKRGEITPRTITMVLQTYNNTVEHKEFTFYKFKRV